MKGACTKTSSFGTAPQTAPPARHPTGPVWHVLPTFRDGIRCSQPGLLGDDALPSRGACPVVAITIMMRLSSTMSARAGTSVPARVPIA
jgi:hypothetical protein